MIEGTMPAGRTAAGAAFEMRELCKDQIACYGIEIASFPALARRLVQCMKGWLNQKP